jgi:CheY-like chemotaxis protein
VLVSLINDVLDFTKIEAGKLSLVPTDFALAPVIADVCSLHASLAGQKQVTLDSSLGPDVPPFVVGDASRLSQVLGNLLNNAMKFTDHGAVSLQVTRQPCTVPRHARLRFEVRDTGVGIATEVLPLLFTAFVQADSSTTRRYGGTGLGLSLCQQLVAHMGGRIVVESTPGQGSRFWFDLELPVGVPRTPSRPGLASPPSSPGSRVLVVDDNPINLKVAAALAEKAGFVVDTAVDGALALEAVQRFAYAVVLMDCHMPTMDGFEATRRIRALPGELGQTPIVALTASARQEDLEACLEVGMNDYLAKPVTFATLVDVLERARRPAVEATPPPG